MNSYLVTTNDGDSRHIKADELIVSADGHVEFHDNDQPGSQGAPASSRVVAFFPAAKQPVVEKTGLRDYQHEAIQKMGRVPRLLSIPKGAGKADRASFETASLTMLTRRLIDVETRLADLAESGRVADLDATLAQAGIEGGPLRNLLRRVAVLENAGTEDRDSSKRTRTALNDRLGHLETSVNGLMIRVTDMEGYEPGRFKDLDRQLDEHLNEGLETLARKWDAVDARLASMDNRITQLERMHGDRIAGLERRTAAMQGDREVDSERITNLSKRVDEHDSTLVQAKMLPRA